MYPAPIEIKEKIYPSIFDVYQTIRSNKGPLKVWDNP
jgi:hypothetical protein